MKYINRWIYVIIGVVVLIFSGIIYGWSVLSGPLVGENGWTDSALTWVSTIVMSFFCLGGFFGGLLQKKVNIKVNMWLSAILFVSGFILMSQAQTIIIVYVGFGILGGLGAGFSYNAIMSTISKWFPDKQGSISGILLMGFGIGSFVIGKIYIGIVSSGVSWRTMFFALGIICLAVIGIAGFFTVKPPDGYKGPAGVKADIKAKAEPYEEVNTFEMVRRSSFWLVFVWAIFVSVAGTSVLFLGRPIAVSAVPDLINSPGTVATAVGLISIFNGIGRIIFGAIFDKIGYKFTLICCCAVLIIAMSIVIIALLTHNIVILFVAYIVTGLGFGGVTPSQSAFVNKFYGIQYYPVNFSIMVMNLMISSFGAKVADAVHNATGSYIVVLVGIIGLCVLGVVASILIKKPNTSHALAKNL